MKIGIITIFGITNYGSALQAYALQKYISTLPNCKAELINYVYPNKFHKSKKGTLIKKIRNKAHVIKEILFNYKYQRKYKFKQFGKKFHILSPQEYKSIEEIEKNPPLYDIYVTGSDQVWNIYSLKNDPVMYCSFAPSGAKKIAFGASMAIKKLPSEFIQSIQERLSTYSFIGGRESSGVNIINSLGLPNNIIISETCDPTLLLSSEQYSEIAQDSKLNIKGEFVLVYFLDYAFDPHPAIEKVIDTIKKTFKIPIIVIGSSKIHCAAHFRYINNIGPSDFVWLMEQATYIITSSFHGLMFSLIFRKPFTAIAPATTDNKDSRIEDVLKTTGLINRMITSNSSEISIDISTPFSTTVEFKIHDYINHSKILLHKALGFSV